MANFRIVKETLTNGKTQYRVEEKHTFLWISWWTTVIVELFSFDIPAVFNDLSIAKKFINKIDNSIIRREIEQDS